MFGKYNNKTIQKDNICAISDNYIIHFNVNIRKNERNKLTRENYCIPSNKIDYKAKNNIKQAEDFLKKHKRYSLLCPPWVKNIPNEVYKDHEHYTDEFVSNHYRNCMNNFDLNMKFFSNINHDEFDKYLLKFVQNNKFIEIKDLNILNEKKGIYILVLDNYNQVYLGISTSNGGVKKRIMTHWSNRKDFGRLLNGTVENSILSIDSFGALDTTRIFYKELKWYQDIDKYEAKLVDSFNPLYRLNRVTGGMNSEEDSNIRNMKLITNSQTRDMK